MLSWQAWDPVLILGQIAALQCLFYLTLGLLQALFLAGRAGMPCKLMRTRMQPSCVKRAGKPAPQHPTPCPCYQATQVQAD